MLFNFFKISVVRRKNILYYYHFDTVKILKNNHKVLEPTEASSLLLKSSMFKFNL